MANDEFGTPPERTSNGNLMKSFHTPVQGGNRISGMFSPAGRRMLGSIGGAVRNSPSVMMEATNDDQQEKRERILETANKAKKAATQKAALREGQDIDEHYHACLKLSAENKITAKNAFSLHLIDYVEEILNKDSLIDFQLAGLTIDACGKIYACRVDALHAQVYRMLANLNRGFRKDGQREQEGDENGDTVHPEEGAGDMLKKGMKKKVERMRKKNKTIVTNAKNVTVTDRELENLLDPRFRKPLADFDICSTSNILLNNIRTYDDSSELVLDPRRDISGQSQPAVTSDSSQEKRKMVDISEFQSTFMHILKNRPEICPAFTDFKFSDDNDRPGKTLSEKDLSRFRFNRDEEPYTAIETARLSDEHSSDVAYGGEFDDDNDTGSNFNHNHVPSKSVMVDGHSTNMISLEETIARIRSGDMSALKEVLAQNSEYSYLKEDFIKAWVGPDNWKALTKKRASAAEKSKKKKPKEPFLVTFEDEEEPSTNKRKKKKTNLAEQHTALHFRRSKKPTAMKVETMLKHDASTFLLPEQTIYEPEQLKQLYFVPECRVERQPLATKSIEVNNYDYENNNDVNNYCPDVNADDPHALDDDDDMDLPPNITLTAPSIANTQQSNDIPGTNMENGIFIGENLLPQPRMIPRIQIDYARVAKTIDVKKVKLIMSTTINTCLETEPTSPLPQNEQRQQAETHLTDVIRMMKIKLPRQIMNDMSLPIAFFCLLNIANEQNLKLFSNEELSDVTISK